MAFELLAQRPNGRREKAAVQRVGLGAAGTAFFVEACGRMQAYQCRFAGRLGVAVRHANGGCFLQGQDIAEIVGEIFE